MENKLILNHHAGNILVESEFSKEFLCNIYDNTHPILTARNKLNFIGGGKEEEDLSPIFTVRREVLEEFSLKKNQKLEESVIQDSGTSTYVLPEVGEMASLKDINMAKSAILENLISYQDFLFTFKEVKGGPKLKTPIALFSVFYSKIPQETFEIIRKNIKNKKSLVNDGFLKITTIDKIVSGNILTAWGSGRIFEHYSGKKIPNPENVKSKPIGKPLISYKDYLKSFNYVRF